MIVIRKVLRIIQSPCFWIPSAVLITIRVSLPWVLTQELNHWLATQDDIHGQGEDIDLSLVRGVYELEGVEFRTKKKDPDDDLQLARIESTTVNIDYWKLIQGVISAEVFIRNAVFTYILEIQKRAPQAAQRKGKPEHLTEKIGDWRRAFRRLLLIRVKTLEVLNSEARFIIADKKTRPPIEPI